MEHGIKTGQLFVGSKFTGVASMARAYGGTGLPPCPAYDFSSAFSGTFARTVEPGEKGTPPNFKEPPAAAAINVERTFSAMKIWLAMINLFKICVSSKRFWPGGKVSTAHSKRNGQPNSMNASLDSLDAGVRYAAHAYLQATSDSVIEYRPDDIDCTPLRSSPAQR